MAEENDGGLLGKLKAWAVTPDEPVKPKAKPAVKTAVTAQGGGPAMPFPTTPQVYSTAVNMLPVQVDPEVRKRLEAALLPAAQPALSALQESMRKLEQALPDPNQRLAAALAMLSGPATPKQVVVDADEALRELTAQEKKAADTANAARQQQIGGMETKIKANDKRLQELEAERTRLIEESERLRGEMSHADAQINATLSAITSTAAVMRQELEQLKLSVQQRGV